MAFLRKSAYGAGLTVYYRALCKPGHQPPTKEDTVRQPTTYPVQLPDIALNVSEWPGEGDPVLLLHATGFHSRCWDEIARRLPGVHLYAVDLRFHGGSDRHGKVDWQLLASDIKQLLEKLDLQNVVGVGHSLGGYLTAHVGALQLARFKQLILIDPVIFARKVYLELEARQTSTDPTQNPVSRRKNLWTDAEEMYQRFCNRAPFDRWQTQILRDYCAHALRAVPGETALQLACDPLHEASIYQTSGGNETIHDLLPQLTLPVTILRAPPDLENPLNLAASPTWPGLVDALPNAREIYLPELSHFIPMEDPELVARIIREAVGDGGANR
jgi:pimeloyl-ACP methyl ester carboxylesterase